MIYLSITATSIEIVQTSKSLFDREEKITAVSRKILSKDDSVVSTINEALKTAYPSPINQDQCRLVIEDDELIIKRINIENKTITSDEVIAKAKTHLPHDITFYENFYKEINNQSEPQILYTALPLSKIKTYAQLLGNCGLKLSFMSSTAFSIYALLKPLVTDADKLVYAIYDHTLKFILMDSEGPIEIIDKKTTAKTLLSDIKSAFKKIKTDLPGSNFKFIIGGEKSLELNTESITEGLEIQVQKISGMMDSILMQQKIKIDTGGVPAFYFDKVLGLFNLSKMSEVPNFAVDLKNILESPVITPPSASGHIPQETGEVNQVAEIKEINEDNKIESDQKTHVRMEVEEKTEEISATPVNSIDENIVEYKNTDISTNGKNRSFMVFLFLAVALILFGGFLIIGQSSFNLPFTTKPSPTPTIVLSPTLSPTPTIDPTLKKSEIKLSVLNGTDKPGFAKENSDKLKEAGFENITVGNADRDDYESTVIRIKDSKKNYLPLLIADLKDSFDTSTIETLPEDSASDVVIVLGQK